VLEAVPYTCGSSPKATTLRPRGPLHSVYALRAREEYSSEEQPPWMPKRQARLRRRLVAC